MKFASIDRRVRRALSQHIENLEHRVLLSATKVSDIPSQSLFASNGPTQITLSTYLNDPSITGGTVVEMQTPLGNIPLQLTDSQTPMTVANFVQYINNGQYTPTLFQRSVPGFILQGGGTKPDGSTNNPVASLNGEPGIPNNTGTIAMALSSGPNSGTNQWFINLANNAALNGTQDGGPFTVFGNVIDGGMNIVNAIAALPTIDGSSENPDWTGGAAGGNIPVINYTGPNPLPAGTTLPQSNIVTDNIVVVPAAQAAPQYSVIAANPSIVTASVANGVLSLAVPAGVTSGSTTVTATVTDIGGETASSTFNVTVGNGSATSVALGAGAARSVTYTDTDGTTATISLRGPGNAAVNFAGSDLVPTTHKNKTVTVASTAATIGSITTTGTTGASTLVITTRGGTRSIDVGGISTDALKAISGKGVNLTGALTSTASISQLVLASATGGAISAGSIGTFTSSGTVADNITLTGTGISLSRFIAGSITGGNWAVAGNVKSISAGSVSGWAPNFASPVTTLSVTKGDLSGTLTAVSFKILRIHGNLSNATVQLSGSGNDLATLSATGDIAGSTIRAVGSLGRISASALQSSQIYAGVGSFGVNSLLPQVTSDFVTDQTITSLRLKPNVTNGSFFNSDVAAATIGTLSLGTINTNNGGITDGIAAETIKAFAATFAIKHVHLKALSPASNVNTTLANEGVLLGDFVIMLI